MAQQTSDHIKPCNIGSSEAHNRRTPEYLKNISKERFYIRTDLTPQNSSWESTLMEGKDLTAYYNEIARMVKEKTGRAMQTKERTVTDKKTGKTKKVNGSSPLRESVVVCKADTTIDQLRAYCDRCHQQWGITALQIFIHLDEGHYGIPSDKTTWKPNCHAHIVWDWMNHETGKSCKLGKEDMSRMQDMVAECLEMERGTRKEQTGKTHLERTDFIIAKQKQEAEQAASKNEQLSRENRTLEQTHSELDKENRMLEKINAELDDEIARKQDKADRENGNFLLAKTASFFGKGELSELREENAVLRAQINELQGTVSQMRHRHKEEFNKLKRESRESIQKANAEVQKHLSDAEQKAKVIERQESMIDKLMRLAYPNRYRLSSGAELLRIHVANYLHPSLHIWTQVGDEVFEDTKFQIDYAVAKAHFNRQLTDEEFVNAVFEPQEQVNDKQAQLLGAALDLAMGGPAQVHVGTGSGGTHSDLPWGEKKKNSGIKR